MGSFCRACYLKVDFPWDQSPTSPTAQTTFWPNSENSCSSPKKENRQLPLLSKPCVFLCRRNQLYFWQLPQVSGSWEADDVCGIPKPQCPDAHLPGSRNELQNDDTVKMPDSISKSRDFFEGSSHFPLPKQANVWERGEHMSYWCNPHGEQVVNLHSKQDISLYAGIKARSTWAVGHGRTNSHTLRRHQILVSTTMEIIKSFSFLFLFKCCWGFFLNEMVFLGRKKKKVYSFQTFSFS